MGEMRNAYNIVTGKLEGKTPVGRPRRRWEYNIRMDLWETGWKVVVWMHLTQNRKQWWALVNTVMHLRVS
jgi:hypothetical protein